MDIVKAFYGGLGIKQLAKRYYDEQNRDKKLKERITKEDALFSVQEALLKDLKKMYRQEVKQ